MLAAIFQVDIG